VASRKLRILTQICTQESLAVRPPLRTPEAVVTGAGGVVRIADGPTVRAVNLRTDFLTTPAGNNTAAELIQPPVTIDAQPAHRR
jgi:hypothetical protein